MTGPKPTLSPHERRTRRTAKALRAALWCLLLLWVLWIVENLVGEKNAWITMLTYVPQFPFLVFPTVLLALALARREWKAAGLNGMGLAFWLIWGMGCVVPLRWPFGSHQTYAHIKVMSFNILGGEWGVERIAQVVRRENPDVVCFQEARTPGGGDLVPSLKAVLPGYQTAQAREVATFSKFSIEGQKAVMLPKTTGRAFLVTMLKVPGLGAGQFHRVRLVNVHFTALKISELRQNGASLYARQINQGNAAREGQKLLMLNAARDTMGTPNGLLMVGDFNTPPRGRLYRSLLTQWQDAFRSAGSGLGHTFSSRLPLVRIDYIWTDPRFVVRRCTPLEPLGVSRAGTAGMASDHRPLVAELDLLP